VPERSSSSPSAEPTVSSIRRKGSAASVVTLDDGSFFLISDDDVSRLALAEGAPVDSHALETAAARHELASAYEKAIALIARRDHAAGELETKLAKRRFSRETIDATVRRLTEERLLDDQRFAEEFLRQRLERHPEGPPLLRARLTARGIEREIADSTVSCIVDEQVVRRALERAARKLADGGRRGEKLRAALLRRGFPSAAVRDQVRRLFPDD